MDRFSLEMNISFRVPSKHSAAGCDLLLIAPITAFFNNIGAFKNGTHATKLRHHYVVMNIGKQCPHKTSVFVVRLNCAT